MHWACTCSLQVYGCRACMHPCISAKTIVSIHWTLTSNFNFIHHHQILHLLKAITKFGNVHACLRMLGAHACTYHFSWVHPWYLLNNLTKFHKVLTSFNWNMKVCLLPKLCACFHVLCVHACTCTPTNIINQFRRPISSYAENFMKIRLI